MRRVLEHGSVFGEEERCTFLASKNSPVTFAQRMAMYGGQMNMYGGGVPTSFNESANMGYSGSGNQVLHARMTTCQRS